jgi:cellulose 1,4-beta-cellobiosidase
MRLVSSRTRKQRLAIGAVAVLGLGGLSVIQALPASAAAGCSVTYSISNQWNPGFQGNIVVRNVGDAWTSWNLTFSFANGQTVQQGWGGRFSQSGANVTVANEGWNGSVANGASFSLGFIGNWSGTNSAPTTFAVNGTTCTGAPVTTNPTTGNPTGNPTTPPTTPPTSNPTTGPPGQRAENPYSGGSGYVNPEWKAKADGVSGGSRVSSNPTAVWIDRIAAIEGTSGSSSNGPMGVEDHLLEAVEQGASYIQFVIYNLPGRDCAALASNGELGPTEIDRYKTAYIDPIAAYQADARFRSLRIINIIEIDSLPNLITNVSGRPTETAMCNTMKSNGNYVNGVGYALAKLGAIPNVYNYIDAAHHGWVGWDDNFGPTAELLATAARAQGSNIANVTGFITNTANYSALTEPYITITEQNRQSKWIDWNRYNDELSFAQAFRSRLVQAGFSSNIGMLIDTSRNGWGGSARPTGPQTTGTLDEQINGSKIDRRIHKGNWCNQSGAGLGERPRVAPASGIDAYVWVKPPGESDGSSTEIPNNEGKGFDQMCDPNYAGNARNGNNRSGALSGAPISGAWFAAQFQQLMQNAYPAL